MAGLGCSRDVYLGNFVPTAPTAVVATAARDSADVTWQAPASGNPITGYFVTVIAASVVADGGVLDAGDGTTMTVTGLTTGISYTFSVVARNAIGVGPAGLSEPVFPFDLPGAPTNVVADAGHGQAQVSWTAPSDDFSPITAYTVSAAPGGQTATTDGMSVSAIVTGLEDGTSYSFLVTATNAAGVGLPASSNTVAPFALVTRLAGEGDAGWADGTGGAAQFAGPFGIAVDAQGYVYVGDSLNNRIRKIAPDGTTVTLAGNGSAGYVDGDGGPNGTTEFNYPAGVAVDAQGFVYVADANNSAIRRVAPDGTTTTFAGVGQFNDPNGVAVDALGNVYVADTNNNRICTVTPDGTISTLAGGLAPPDAGTGFSDGSGGPYGSAHFVHPAGLAVDAQGVVYVADSNRIRRLEPGTGDTLTLAGNGGEGWADGTGHNEGTAEFFYPIGVAVDARGFIYVGDSYNDRIRTVVADGGQTSTLAGDGHGGFADGKGGVAEFQHPAGVAVDAQGNVYVADTDNNRIRKIIP